LSYQWIENGSAISGATAASYTTPPTTAADNGAVFTVLVSNSLGSVTSYPATLTVSSSPVGTTPSSQNPINVFYPLRGQVLYISCQNVGAFTNIYTKHGEIVRKITNSVFNGSCTATWDGDNDAGSVCATGIYLSQEDGVKGKPEKVILLK
jgi:hypothetical protein